MGLYHCVSEEFDDNVANYISIVRFCTQPPIRHPFALANFQLGRKGQRPKGRKVKRPKFQKLSEAFLIKSKVVPDDFMSIFKQKGPIS